MDTNNTVTAQVKFQVQQPAIVPGTARITGVLGRIKGGGATVANKHAFCSAEDLPPKLMEEFCQRWDEFGYIAVEIAVTVVERMDVQSRCPVLKVRPLQRRAHSC